MNIQKNELLLLNKIKFGAGESTNTTAAPVPQEGTQTPEAGMKALTFMGMKNLMSNPNLAQQIGANGNNGYAPSFKRADIKTMAMAGLMTIASIGAFTSCKPEADEIRNEVNVVATQEQDQEMTAALLAAINALMGEVQGMRSDMTSRDAAWQTKYTQFMSVMGNLISAVSSIQGDVSSIKAVVNQIRADFNSYVDLIKDHFASEAEAVKWLQTKLDALEQGQITTNEFLSDIRDLVFNIDANVSELLKSFKEYADKQDKYNFLALMYAQQTAANTAATAFNTGLTAYNTAMTNAKLDKLNESVDSVVANIPVVVAKLDGIEEAIVNADANNTAAIKDAKEALLKLGYTKIQIDAMNDAQILAELRAQNAKLDQISKDLKTIKEQQAQGLIDNQKYAEEVTKLLRGIKHDIGGLTMAVVDLHRTVKESSKQTNYYLKNIMKSSGHNAYYTQKLYEAYAAEAADRAAEREAIAEIIPLLQNIDGTTTNIYEELQEKGLETDKIEEFFKILNEHQEDRNKAQIDAAKTNKDEIIEAINSLGDKLDLQQVTQDAILDALGVITDKIDNGNPGTTEKADLTKIENELADLVAIARALKSSMPNYSQILNEIKDLSEEISGKIKGCECEHNDYTIILEKIIEKIENINKSEGIQNNMGQLIV